jgi:hypothetical protein
MHDTGDVLFDLYNGHDERSSSTEGDFDQQSRLDGNVTVLAEMKGVILHAARV